MSFAMSVMPTQKHKQQLATRTSAAECQDTIELEPHQAEILTVKFSPTGRTVATASADKTIQLISVYGENDVLLTLKGHKQAVTDAHWSVEGDRIFSCSADRTAIVWDLSSGQSIKRLYGHDDIINACCIGKDQPNIAMTGDDDGRVKIWDLRVMKAAATFTEKYQVLSVALDDSMYRAFSGSLDGKIYIFDIRKVVVSPPTARREEERDPSLLNILTGHANAITSIALTSDHSILCSNSMDQTLRLWDVKPCTARAEDARCFAAIRGPTHNFEQMLHRARWNKDSTQIAAGSADRCAYIFDVRNVEHSAEPANLLFKLPGHLGACTEVDFHPSEPMIASGGADKLLFLRRLTSLSTS